MSSWTHDQARCVLQLLIDDGQAIGQRFVSVPLETLLSLQGAFGKPQPRWMCDDPFPFGIVRLWETETEVVAHVHLTDRTIDGLSGDTGSAMMTSMVQYIPRMRFPKPDCFFVEAGRP